MLPPYLHLFIVTRPSVLITSDNKFRCLCCDGQGRLRLLHSLTQLTQFESLYIKSVNRRFWIAQNWLVVGYSCSDIVLWSVGPFCKGERKKKVVFVYVCSLKILDKIDICGSYSSRESALCIIISCPFVPSLSQFLSPTIRRSANYK